MGIEPALFDVWGATLGMATFTDIDKRFSTACVRIYWEISIQLIFDLVWHANPGWHPRTVAFHSKQHR